MSVVAISVMLAFPVAWRPLRGPLTAVFAVFAATFPLRVMHGVLLGAQDLAFVGMVAFAQWLVAIAVTLALVANGVGLWAMAIGWAAGQVVSAALWWWRVPRLLPGVLPSRLPFLAWREIQGLLSRGVWFSLSQIANVLLVSTDLLVIGKLLGPAAVVPYAVTGKLIAVLANQPQMFTLSAIPALSDMRQRDERDRMLHTLEALTQLLLLGSGAVACVVLAVNGGFVRWWVGVEQYGGDLLTTAMLCTMLFRHFALSTSLALHSYGNYDRRSSLTSIADGAVSVLAGVALVRLLGPIGATLGSLIGVLLVSLPLNLHVIAREHMLRMSAVLARVAPVAWRAALVAAVVLAGQRAWRPAGPVALALAGAAAVALYTLVMLPLLRRHPLNEFVLPRLHRLLQAVRLRPAA
jgi:O-antigen/teichoic acid export membrane protein